MGTISFVKDLREYTQDSLRNFRRKREAKVSGPGAPVYRCRWLSAVLLAVACVAPCPAGQEAAYRLNLFQTRATVRLNGDAAAAARGYFSSRPAPGELPAQMRDVVLRSVPAEFRDSCDAMTRSWGDEAKGAAEWRVRLLALRGDQAWLAFHCATRVEGLEKFYDERLALLRLNSATLELVPFASDAPNDSTLFHVDFQESFPLQGAEVAVFHVSSANENPCCDGGDSTSQERLAGFAPFLEGVSEVLSVVTHQDDFSHDDEDGDGETIYNAQVEFERNGLNQVIVVSGTFTEDTNDFVEVGGNYQPHLASRRTGTVQFRWNAAARKFEEVK